MYECKWKKGRLKKELGRQMQRIQEQFQQNNNRDTKSIILLLIPFIDDKNDNKLYKKIYDLNQILYHDPYKKEINKELFNYEMSEARKLYFPICNYMDYVKLHHSISQFQV